MIIQEGNRYYVDIEVRRMFFKMGWELYSAELTCQKTKDARGMFWLFNGAGDKRVFFMEDHFEDINNPTEDEMILFDAEFGCVEKCEDSRHYALEFGFS